MFILNKDIYIIKNTVNKKVYIGQSKNVFHRWQQHISAARNKPCSLIDSEMKSIGIEKFYYEILEQNVENYNEREEYWINYYNTLVPNGYNIISNYIYNRGIRNKRSKFISNDVLSEVINLIKNTNLSFQKIAKIYGCCQEVISAINLGKRYYTEEIIYPIRQNRYDKEKIKQIVYSLKYELDKTIKDISKEYNIDLSQVSKINSGKIHPIPNTKYPIRKGKVTNPIFSHIDEIIELLKNTDIPQKDIAKRFNVSVACISSINKGNSYKKQGIEYPIRKNYQCNNGGRKCFSPNELLEIEKELKESNKSIRDIAKEFECGITTIMNINNGSIIKYRKQNVKYPIRNPK